MSDEPQSDLPVDLESLDLESADLEPLEFEPMDLEPVITETVTQEDVVVRRTPRYWRFMLLGAVVFAVAALIATYSRPEQPGYDRNVVFGFLLLFGVAIGMGIGAVFALIAERLTRRSARTYLAERITTTERDPRE